MRLVEDFQGDHDFELVPSISSDLACPYHIDKDDPQMRQEHACEYERVTLCAADTLVEVSRQTTFLACMDEAPLPLAYNESYAHSCTLAASGEDESAWAKALDCFNGQRGDELVAHAQAETAAAEAGIPSVLVNGTLACGKGVPCDYDNVAVVLRQ